MEKAAVCASSARLRPVKGLPRRIQKTVRVLGKMPREELPPGGAWLLEHGRFLLEEAEITQRETRFCPLLPAQGGEPRVLTLARQVIAAGEGEVTAPLIVRLAREFYADEEPRQAELHLLPRALSCALLMQADASMRACLREAAARRRGKRWAGRFSIGRSRALPRGEETLLWGLDALAQMERADALRRAERLMSRQDRRIPDRLEEQAACGLRDAQVIASLHRLHRLPFDRIIERLSPVAAVLRAEETYRRMDDAGRAAYQQAAERLAKRFGVSESALARTALLLASEGEGAAGEAGYYLLERPEKLGEALLHHAPKGTEKRKTALFLLPLYGGTALTLAAAAALGAPWFVWPEILLCVSELLRWAFGILIRRRLPPRAVPRLRLTRLSRETRTLVAVPALLTSRRQAVRMVRQLSILHHANPDRYLDFLLLADFADGDREKEAEDGEILAAAREAVRALNESLGGGFYYLHRARQWNGERFSGRERKRGALEMLNHLLTDGRRIDPIACASFDVSRFQGRYRYVITLDADTLLPPGAAHQLVGAMEHPLQKGRLGVLQPRMEVAADTVATRAQALLGGKGGSDLYGLRQPEIYQDVFGRGSFAGKGIYQPALWMERLENRLPQGVLLSHDLIEGEVAISALADDIVLYDGHPSTLAGWQKRLHRWTRGDWQLLPFLGDKRLSLLSRHKIWDNLRRSLVPAAQTLLLILGTALRQPVWMLLALPWPLRGLPWRLLLLPGKAYTLLDAAVRALWRRLVSHRLLLEWTTAAQADKGQLPLPCLLAQAACGALITMLSLLPGGLWPGALIGILWLSGPLWPRFADRPRRGAAPMTAAQREAMRRLARDTWRFFEDTVGAATLFLPPDNEQIEPRRGPAMRSSPTNIGLYLLSCCAAREMGFISSKEMAERLSRAVDTLETLETWKGHFYNWYDLDGGAPLAPRFVSTVDSGNLAACLVACAQLCRQHGQELPDETRALPRRLDALFARMEFAALYDGAEQLFFVGFDPERGKPTPAHYDLLASEARLTSFLAVTTGQAPLRHWKRLGRAVARVGGGPALLSWGGTMFEYLMPQLLLPITPGTLIGEGCLHAVRGQMAQGAAAPFGVSESGYYAFDAELNYQYRAFGLPSLALSGETAGRVIAPYASLLALPFFPRSCADNALRMEKLGWTDDHGFYEAADYTLGSPPRLVRSHMAHHQGMILCAICNALENDALVRAFTALPAVRGHMPLLLERAPRTARRRRVLPEPRLKSSLPGPCRRTARDGWPRDAHALSSGRLRWVISPGGRGYLAWKDILLTRFDPDAAQLSGPQLYLREAATGRVFSPLREASMRFESGSVQAAGDWERLRVRVSMGCVPLTEAAVMRLTLENTGRERRQIEAVSFLEVALSTLADDRAHPNYRDLSVRVLPWEKQGLIAQRLPRDEQDAAPLLGHFAAGDFDALRCQGDRALFLGRMGGYELPQQLLEDADLCARRTGDTLAPCLSLRLRITLGAGEKKTVDFVTLCRGKREDFAASLLRPAKWQSAFSLAFAQDQMLLRALGVDAAALALYQQVLGALLWTGQPHQAAGVSSSRQALWRLGVSGTRPTWMVSLTAADRPLLRHALRCHAWMRSHGVHTDLILFCPQEGQYRRPVLDEAKRALALSRRGDAPDPGEGVIVFSGTQEEREAVSRACRLVLVSGLPLKEQLLRLAHPQIAAAPPPMPPRPVTPRGWQGDHAFGGFTREGAYAVCRPAPVPWHNLLCNDRFGTLVCETGILHSYAGNSRLGIVTRMNPDVYRGVPSEEIYLRGEEGTLYPLVLPTAVHAPGVTEYRCLCGDVLSTLTMFTHESRPAGVRLLSLRSEKEQHVTVYWLVRFALGEHPEDTRCHLKGGLALARADGEGAAWAGLEGARCRILPSALASLSALDSQESGGGSVALFSLALILKAHTQEKAAALIGFSADEAQAEADAQEMARADAGQMERDVRALWQQRLGGLTLFAGDAGLERMLNLWLPYQTITSRLLARMGPYQAGGAWGFRDQLQDLLMLLYTDPDWARAHVLRCAAHQFPEGDVQHWWHPPRRGVRTRISDDRLFLPFMTALYVKITGDTQILQEQAPYLDSAPLTPGERDRYEEPAVSTLTEGLLAHCRRAVDSVRLGAHGLPLMGGGDWNDGMNRVGGEKGESVWLGFFLAIVLREIAPLCDPPTREKYQALRRTLLENAENAWTGQWYLRAWYDGGEALGGPDTHPPRIDLISQAFAVLAGAPRAHAVPALRAALRQLYDREAGIVKLLDPPFSPEEKAGYIGAYLPGVRENGGQYTHAVPWLILALCKTGAYEWAWEIARTELPCAHADTEEKTLVYRAEPYVLAADVYAGENRGRAGWTWYTGSAAWMHYVWITTLLGFEKRGKKARLAPCPGSGMDEFTLVYRFGSSRWHLTASRDTVYPIADGEKLPDGWATLTDDGRTHEARFPMK